MLGQKNKTHIVVGKDLAPLTETQTREDLVAGTVGVFKNGMATAIDGTTDLVAGDRFKIVYMDVDSNIIESPMYDYDLLKRKKAANYAATTEQKTFIGYNGTTGSIAITNSENYVIHVTRRDWSKTYGEHGCYKLGAAYTSDASALQNEIADALVVNLSKNFAEEKTRSGVTVTNVSRINSEAVTAGDDFVNAMLVVKGEAKLVGQSQILLTGSSGTANVTGVGGLTKLATFATNLATTAANFVTAHAAAYAVVGVTLTTTTSGATNGVLLFTPAHATVGLADPVITNATGDQAGTVFTAFEYATNTSLAVNDYVRLGATVTTATTLTSSIYKVLTISGNVATLDIPVVEPTGTYTAASAGNIEAITNADAIAEDWGLCLESEPVKFIPGLFKFQNVTFDLGLTNFGATIVTDNTSAFKGSGSYKEVAEIEWELRGNRGEGFKVADYPVSQNLNATLGKTYDMISLDFENDNARNFHGKEYSFHSLVIATENESSFTLFTDLKDILNIS